MKRVGFATLFLVAGISVPLSAQTPSSAPQAFRVGFGVSISNASGTVTPAFLVPIDVTSKIRVEPEVSYSRVTSEQTIEQTIQTFQPVLPTVPPGLIIGSPIVTSTTAKQTTASTSIGTGVYFMQSRGTVKLHYGGRVGYARTSLSLDSSSVPVTPNRSSSSNTAKQTGFFAGPVLGGEYAFSDRFSLGAELQVRYTSLDTSQQQTFSAPVSPSPIVFQAPKVSGSQTIVQTRAAVIARIYVR